MEIKPYKNNFEKLKSGTLFRSIQKENGEPENIALGQISKELSFLQRQSQYVGEIERVAKELHLTTTLIKDCKTTTTPEGVTRQELLAYYQGNFLTLVHQMKDKIMQLVNLITETAIPDKPSMEGDISVSDLLKKKEAILDTIGIKEAVKEWEQSTSTGGIAVALRKRTHHHHRVSGLRYDQDYLNLGFADIATEPNFQASLTEYGKERIEKMRLESTERLFVGALSKAESTLKVIDENIETISEALVKHFKLPTTQEEVAEILQKQGEMFSSFDVKNRCSIDNVIEPHKTVLNEFVEKIKGTYGELVEAIYLVGSLPRGEYEEGYSDINVYVVLSLEDGAVMSVREDRWFSLRVFTKKHFLSEEAERFRVITKADGILLHGKDLVADEKLPKAGLFLALTLFGDILEILDEAKKWMEENPTASQGQISRKSRRLAKRILDFIYGVSMSNKPHYTASRKERVERILEDFPKKDVIDTLMGMTRYGVGEFESFKNTFEGFRPQAEENLRKMRDVKIAIDKQEKKK